MRKLFLKGVISLSCRGERSEFYPRVWRTRLAMQHNKRVFFPVQWQMRWRALAQGRRYLPGWTLEQKGSRLLFKVEALGRLQYRFSGLLKCCQRLSQWRGLIAIQITALPKFFVGHLKQSLRYLRRLAELRLADTQYFPLKYIGRTQVDALCVQMHQETGSGLDTREWASFPDKAPLWRTTTLVLAEWHPRLYVCTQAWFCVLPKFVDLHRLDLTYINVYMSDSEIAACLAGVLALPRLEFFRLDCRRAAVDWQYSSGTTIYPQGFGEASLSLLPRFFRERQLRRVSLAFSIDVWAGSTELRVRLHAVLESLAGVAITKFFRAATAATIPSVALDMPVTEEQCYGYYEIFCCSADAAAERPASQVGDDLCYDPISE